MMECFKRKKKFGKDKEDKDKCNKTQSSNSNLNVKSSETKTKGIKSKFPKVNVKVINGINNNDIKVKNVNRKHSSMSGTFGGSKSMDNLHYNRVNINLNNSNNSRSGGESPILSPGVDLSQQQKILEYRRRGGKMKPNSTLNLSSGGQMGFIGLSSSAGGGGGGVKENHNECKKKEQKLKQELEQHSKYIEQQAVALQRMEQTIAYQYAIIQQLTQQVESGGVKSSSGGGGGPNTLAEALAIEIGSSSSSSSSSTSSSPDPLAELTKQFQQMAAMEQAQVNKRSRQAPYPK